MAAEVEPVHPYLEEGLAREHLGRLYREAERERIARQALPVGGEGRKARGRLRVALGDRLVRLGMRLAGSPPGHPITVRLNGE